MDLQAAVCWSSAPMPRAARSPRWPSEMGLFRHCAHRWLGRWDGHRPSGLPPAVRQQHRTIGGSWPWLIHSNTRRAHTGRGGHPPISRAPLPTWRPGTPRCTASTGGRGAPPAPGV